MQESSRGHLVELLDLMEKGTLSGPLAKKAFEVMFKTGKSRASVIMEEQGWYKSATAENLL